MLVPTESEGNKALTRRNIIIIFFAESHVLIPGEFLNMHNYILNISNANRMFLVCPFETTWQDDNKVKIWYSILQQQRLIKISWRRSKKRDDKDEYNKSVQILQIRNITKVKIVKNTAETMKMAKKTQQR